MEKRGNLALVCSDNLACIPIPGRTVQIPHLYDLLYSLICFKELCTCAQLVTKLVF